MPLIWIGLLFNRLQALRAHFLSVCITLAVMSAPVYADQSEQTKQICSALDLPELSQGFQTFDIALPPEVLAAHEFWQVILVTPVDTRLLPLVQNKDGAVLTTLPFIDAPETGLEAGLFILAKDSDQAVTFECEPHQFVLKTPPVRDGAFAQMIIRPAPPEPELDALAGYAEAREAFDRSAQNAQAAYDQANREERRAMDALATHMLDRSGALSNAETAPSIPKKIAQRFESTAAMLRPQLAIYRPAEDTSRIWRAAQFSDVLQLVPIAKLERCPSNGAELLEITEILAQANLRSKDWPDWAAFDKKAMRQVEVFLISSGIGLFNPQAAKATQTAVESYITVQDTMDDIIRGSVPTQYKKFDANLTVFPIFEDSPERFRNIEAKRIILHTRSDGYSISKVAIDIALMFLGTETFKKMMPKDILKSRLVPEKARDFIEKELKGDIKFHTPNPFSTTILDGADAVHMRRLRSDPTNFTNDAWVRDLYFDPSGPRTQFQPDEGVQFVYDATLNKAKGKLKSALDPETKAKGFINETAKKETEKQFKELQKDSKSSKTADKPKTKVEGYSSKRISCKVDLTNWKHVASKAIQLPLGNALEKTGQTPSDHKFRAVRAGNGLIELSFHQLPEVFDEVETSLTGAMRKNIPFLETTIEGPNEIQPGETGFYEVSVKNSHRTEDLLFQWSADTTTQVTGGPAPVNRFFITAPTGSCNLNYVLLSVDAQADFLDYSDADRTAPRQIALLPDKEDPACAEPEAEEEYYGGVWDSDARGWLQADVNNPFMCFFSAYNDEKYRIDNPPGYVEARHCDTFEAQAHVSQDRQKLRLVFPDRSYVFTRSDIRYSDVKDTFLPAGAFPSSPAPPMDLFRLPVEAERIAKADPFVYTRERPTGEVEVFADMAVLHGRVVYTVNQLEIPEFSYMRRIPFVSYENGQSTAEQLFPEKVPDENDVWTIPVDDEG